MTLSEPASPKRILAKAGWVVALALAVTSGACAARSGVPRPFPGAALPPGAGETPTERARSGEAATADAAEASTPDAPDAATMPAMLLPDVIQTALGFLGIPYRNGGSDPSGFDCSGFVQYVFGRHGAALPREVRDQYRVGKEVEFKDVRAGDLLFFETVSRGASHIGIAIGEGRFVHAPSSTGVVRVEPYTASYWARRFVGARRVTETTVSASSGGAGFPGAVRSSR